MSLSLRYFRRGHESKSRARRMQPRGSRRRIFLTYDAGRKYAAAYAPSRAQSESQAGLSQTEGAGMRAENTEIVNCPSCGAQLVAGLRFCRMCGYRLGEGVEEYVATQRFDAASMPTAATANPATDPFAPRQTWGAAPIQTYGATSALNQPQGAGVPWAKPARPARGGWWLWMMIGIVLLIALGMIPAALLSRGGGGCVGPRRVQVFPRRRRVRDGAGRRRVRRRHRRARDAHRPRQPHRRRRHQELRRQAGAERRGHARDSRRRRPWARPSPWNTSATA